MKFSRTLRFLCFRSRQFLYWTFAGNDESWLYSRMYSRAGLCGALLFTILLHPILYTEILTYKFHWYILVRQMYNYRPLRFVFLILLRVLYQYIYRIRLTRCIISALDTKGSYYVRLFWMGTDIANLLIMMDYPELIPLFMSRWSYQPVVDSRYSSHLNNYGFEELLLFPIASSVCVYPFHTTAVAQTNTNDGRLMIRLLMVCLLWWLGRYADYRYRCASLVSDLIVYLGIAQQCSTYMDVDPTAHRFETYWNACHNRFDTFPWFKQTRAQHLVSVRKRPTLTFDPMYLYDHARVLRTAYSTIMEWKEDLVFNTQQLTTVPPREWTTIKTHVNTQTLLYSTHKDDTTQSRTKISVPNLLWKDMQQCVYKIKARPSATLCLLTLSNHSDTSDLNRHFRQSPMFDWALVKEVYRYCGWTAPVSTQPCNRLLDASGTTASWLRQPQFATQHDDLAFVRNYIWYSPRLFDNNASRKRNAEYDQQQ